MTTDWHDPTAMDWLCEFIIKLLAYREPAATTHAHLVRDICLKIAQQYGFDDEKLLITGWAALLHDAGKLTISDAVLNKGKDLTKAEWEEMRSHTTLGAEFLAPITAWPEIAEAVLCHHENFDGSGYPARLAGKDIPIMARILRLGDSFEALTEFRNYREVHVYSKALAMGILHAKSEWYDPDLLNILSGIVRVN